MKKFETFGRSLSRDEQKKIMAGYMFDDGAGCSCVMVTPGTCGVRRNGTTIISGWSQADAQSCANHCTSTTGNPYYWCCASC